MSRFFVTRVAEMTIAKEAMASSSIELTRPLPGATFGGIVRLKGGGGAEAVIAAALREPDLLQACAAE